MRSGASYINRISLSGSGSRTTLDLAYPQTASLHGCINALCGLNNAGKTFLLERTRAALVSGAVDGRTSEHYGLSLSLTAGDAPVLLFCGKTWREKSRAGNVNIALTEARLEPPGDVPEYRKVFQRFLVLLLNQHLPINEQLTFADWQKGEVRVRLSEHFAREESVYLCDQKNEIVIISQQLLNATLYFRRAHPKQFDFVLAYADGTKVSFPEWSDGQQMLFYLLVLVMTVNPDIVLLDEIENHLHPAYMSRLLKFLKERVPQTLIATHHPHVIFSELIDRVFYLETSTSGVVINPPAVAPYKKHIYQTPPKRSALLLENEFEKITGAYRLFDQQDAQLMRQATHIAAEADLLVYKALCTAFREPEVATPSDRMLPDLQTKLLVQRIVEFVASPSKSQVRIIDIGSGLGRVAIETAKLSSWQLGCTLNWICWEPDADRRQALRANLSRSGISAEVPESLDDVADDSCDIALLANVLHELPVEAFIGTVRSGASKLSRPGSVIVLELFPLLAPERFAVPYPPSVLLSIFRDWDIHGHQEIVAVRGGVAVGYCIFGQIPSHLPTAESMRVVLTRWWGELEKAAVSAYSSRRAIRSASDYTNVVQELTTLASISAWRNGIWT